VLELDFEHVGPGALCCLVIRERIVAKKAKCALRPKSHT
jgi:hypothetical protein